MTLLDSRLTLYFERLFIPSNKQFINNFNNILRILRII